ncbi:hypothetical protein GCM10022270_01340 [Terriglobus aquaticus]
MTQPCDAQARSRLPLKQREVGAEGAKLLFRNALFFAEEHPGEESGHFAGGQHLGPHWVLELTIPAFRRLQP